MRRQHHFTIQVLRLLRLAQLGKQRNPHPPQKKLFFFFVFSTLLPLNFNIYIQILQTDLQTFLERISEEKWQKDQSVYILSADHFANNNELFP